LIGVGFENKVAAEAGPATSTSAATNTARRKEERDLLALIFFLCSHITFDEATVLIISPSPSLLLDGRAFSLVLPLVVAFTS
jgi:hypothetical protein